MADRHIESYLITPPASPLLEEEPEEFSEDEEMADEETHEELYEDEYVNAYGYHQVEYHSEYGVEEEDEFYEIDETSTHSYSSRNAIAATAYLIHCIHQRNRNINIGPNLAALMLDHLGVSPYDPDYNFHLGYLMNKPRRHRIGAQYWLRRQAPLPKPPLASTLTYAEASTATRAELSTSSPPLLPSAPAPASYIQRLPQGPPEYLKQEPFIDFPDEPKWHFFESNHVSPEEEAKNEDRQFLEYHHEILQEIDRAIEEEVRWYTSHTDIATKGMATFPQEQEQEPIIVSMVLVDQVQTSTSTAVSHGEGSSSSNSSDSSIAGIGSELINSAQGHSAAAIVYASHESESFSRTTSLVDETYESAGRGREMSSIERTLRAQAVAALNNPSALLLHAISMNETPSRARLRMYR
ncbi:hypothetical protein EC991_008463 [Linnemannia zychae]|nr:hypothetical protein EC991_008463 [Linnemannia zychae]